MLSYYKHLSLLFKRLLLIMVFMSITRLIFYVFNYSIFTALSPGQVCLHFFYGLRFDLSIIFLFNILFILFSLFPDRILSHKAYQIGLKSLFIAVNSLLIAANLIDTKFFVFEGKRLTGDIFSKEWLGEDFITLLPAFFKDYWYLFLLFGVFVALFARLYPKFIPSKGGRIMQPKSRYFKQAGIAVFLLIISVYAGRGGVQLKPIGIIAAARYTSPEFMPLVLNSPFTIVKTFGNKPLPTQMYFSKDTIDSVYSPVHEFKHHKVFRKKNVVILILESFGREYSGFLNDTLGYTPRFDSLMQRGLTFTNAFANGKRSIEALPSILSGMPALMDNAFVNTKFSSNSIEGLGQILVSKGYTTSFYHGGKNGTMGFDNYIKLTGIEKYYGIDEYPDKADYDGNWGVFDEPYLQYFAREISEMKEPFFASAFTLSSHHPYKIPEKYQDTFPKGELVNLESIGYADYALGEFFKTAAQKPWFKNTLFVITADHTAQAMSAYYHSNMGKYAVPLVFYAPGDRKISGISNNVCQQADILPSVLDYLGYDQAFNAFGNSVFSADSQGFAISYLSGIYQLITNKAAINFDGTKVLDREFQPADSALWDAPYTADSISVAHAENLLKGIIQQYNFRMEHNMMKYHGKLSDYLPD